MRKVSGRYDGGMPVRNIGFGVQAGQVTDRRSRNLLA